MSKIFVHDLMTISKVLILIIGQNNTNPKLLQPIVTSICKVLAVKKPCVPNMHYNGKFLNENLNCLIFAYNYAYLEIVYVVKSFLI